MHQQGYVTQPQNTLNRQQPVSSGLLQRKCACGKPITVNGECAECNKKRLKLQRKAVNSQTDSQFAPPIVHEVLRSPGRPLPAKTKSFMEPRFNYDFSSVRIHSDEKAAHSAQSVNALAYTVGPHVVFGHGQYELTSNQGRSLLTHELTHVVQQNRSENAMPPAAIKIMAESHPAEIEAQKNAQQRQASATSYKIANQHSVSMQRQANEAEEEGFFSRIAHGIRCILPATENPLVNPLNDISTLQSPGGSGWHGAKFGCFRNNCTRRHRGWDLHATVGTSVRAVVEGTATRRNDPGGFGQYIRLRSSKNPQRTYIYAHLSKRETNGNYCVGDKLGETGVTGNASPNRPHLHFEVRTNNVPQDPAGFLTEPSKVIGLLGAARTTINKRTPAPCTPC